MKMTVTFDVLLIEDAPVESENIRSILDDGLVHLIKYSVNSELEISELPGPDQHFDVAIIDIDTLSEDRPEYAVILHQLQQYNPDCLIIALTADASHYVVKPLLENNVRKIINKPYSAEDILLPIHHRIRMDFEDFQQKVHYEHRIIDKKMGEIKDLIPDKLAGASTRPLFSEKLKQFSKFIYEHFLLEERYMSLYRYPDIDLHQQQHHTLLEDLKELIDFSHKKDDDVDGHLALIDKVETKLNHDSLFLEFVSHLNEVHNVYAT